ncbi:hypothetical protein LY76DRAFT_601874 [Colletotrichum caudatum]|nr:hypothetical protein LY76DRAFT_601874 [Colletotrichum caudatum]
MSGHTQTMRSLVALNHSTPAKWVETEFRFRITKPTDVVSQVHVTAVMKCEYRGATIQLVLCVLILVVKATAKSRDHLIDPSRHDFAVLAKTPRVTPNVKFEVDDVGSRWVNDKKYDFVFCRYMAGNLNPGGWVEFQDYDITPASDDGTLTEKHETRKWGEQLIAA